MLANVSRSPWTSVTGFGDEVLACAAGTGTVDLDLNASQPKTIQTSTIKVSETLLADLSPCLIRF